MVWLCFIPIFSMDSLAKREHDKKECPEWGNKFFSNRNCRVDTMKRYTLLLPLITALTMNHVFADNTPVPATAATPVEAQDMKGMHERCMGNEKKLAGKSVAMHDMHEDCMKDMKDMKAPVSNAKKTSKKSSAHSRHHHAVSSTK